MTPILHKSIASVAILAFLGVASGFPSEAGAASDPGLSDHEIIVGGSHPFTGPASGFGTIGKGIGAYFAFVNDRGGVNGRKIKWIDVDDAYSPPQAVQAVRQLVEQEHIFALLNTLGTAVNMAIRPYLNKNNVPQLFLGGGSTRFGADYKQFPFTIGWQPSYLSESTVYGQDVVRNHPHARIGVLFQNDDYGNDLKAGLKAGLGQHQNLIVKTISYEATDPTVSSQIASLAAAGCDTLMIFATPKAAIQALVAKSQQSWHPLTYLNNVANRAGYMRSAGDAGGSGGLQGVTTMLYLKDPTNHARYKNDAGMKLYRSIMTKYLPTDDQDDLNFLYGMGVAYTFVDCLQRAGRDVTRARLMDAALHLNESNNPMTYEGIIVRDSPSYRFPISQMILAKWVGTDWSPQGHLIDVKPFNASGR